VFVSTIMIGRDLKGFAARDHILCSTDGHPGVGEDDLTKSFFARTGKLILMHGKSQSMHSVPVHQPHRPADGGRHGHSQGQGHRHHADEVQALGKNISRHCHESGRPDYYDICPSAGCYLMTDEDHDLYLIADAQGHHIKVINLEEWSLRRIIGGKGTNEGEFDGITGLASFSISNETYICVCESGNNRIQVLTHVGKPIASTGNSATTRGGGHLRGQFRNPVSITAHFPEYRFYEPGLYEGQFQPPWYLGICSKETLEDQLFVERPRPGTASIMFNGAWM
jgi:hypothetical protein